LAIAIDLFELGALWLGPEVPDSKTKSGLRVAAPKRPQTGTEKMNRSFGLKITAPDFDILWRGGQFVNVW
jgi:hypothetical protein